jgi:hypothetical protein
VCGYIHHGEAPPDICPKCGAGADAFEPMENAGMGVEDSFDYDKFFEDEDSKPG